MNNESEETARDPPREDLDLCPRTLQAASGDRRACLSPAHTAGAAPANAESSASVAHSAGIAPANAESSASATHSAGIAPANAESSASATHSAGIAPANAESSASATHSAGIAPANAESSASAAHSAGIAPANAESSASAAHSAGIAPANAESSASAALPELAGQGSSTRGAGPITGGAPVNAGSSAPVALPELAGQGSSTRGAGPITGGAPVNTGSSAPVALPELAAQGSSTRGAGPITGGAPVNAGSSAPVALPELAGQGSSTRGAGPITGGAPVNAGSSAPVALPELAGQGSSTRGVLIRPFTGFVALGTKAELLTFYKDNPNSTPECYVKHLEALLNFKFQEREESQVVLAIRNLRSRAKTLSSKKGRPKEKVFPPDEPFNVNLAETEDTGPEVSSSSSKLIGRPRKGYTDAAPRTKRKKLEVAVAASSEIPPEDLILKIVKTSNLYNRKDMQKVFQYCLGTPGKLKFLAAKMRERDADRLPTDYTAEGALGLLLDQDLTVSQYKALRRGALSRNSNLYPSYQKVHDAKAIIRPPETDIQITECSAKVSLQALLKLTCRRLLEMCQDVLEAILEQHDSPTFEMQVSWGFDGTTGQSTYKMQMSLGGPPEPNEDTQEGQSRPLSDSSLFVCTLIPLQITQEGRTQEENGRILWRNAVPQSVRFCRPLEMVFAKETSELIRGTKSSIDGQIKDLVPLEFISPLSATPIRVKFKCHLTIIDGKALNVITNTKSSMTCPICHSTPKTFNVLSNIGTRTFAPKSTENLKHGINPMHAYIRLLELVLHISYKMDVKKWQARSAAEKLSVESKKQYLQTELYKQMGLLIDFPAAGGSGNSNDGNTARRAFKRYEEFGAILEFDTELLNRFRIILISINHSFAIDAEKFGEYCTETAHMYEEKYGWYYMSATLHKILIHGKEIIENSALPLGMLSEHAGESKNKCYRRDRFCHARKSSRIANMRDTFLRAMDTSDPLLSSLSLSERQKYLRKEPLPPAAIEMLLCPPLPPQGRPQELFPDEDEDAIVGSDEVQLRNEEHEFMERASRGDIEVLNEMEDDE